MCPTPASSNEDSGSSKRRPEHTAQVAADGRALAAGGGSPSEAKHAAAVRIVARGCACVRIHARGSACRGAIRPAAMGLVLKCP